MIEYTRDGNVHCLVMNDAQNLFDSNFFERFNERLDEVEAECAGDAGLVLTGSGKYFSNGLNLPALGKLEADAVAAFGLTLMRTMGRLVVFPVPTVAAINGHAFAGGALLAAACDYRVMREDRGWLCMAEVDVGVPIDPALISLLRTKLTPNTLRTSVLEGRRFTGSDALEAGWVDALAAERELMSLATKRAADLASKGRKIFGSVKRGLFGEVAAQLGHEVRKGSE
jgi:enoyl-CoA hydratase/carnithine racemase